MAVTPRLIFLVGAAVSLVACSSEQAPPTLPQAMYHLNPNSVRKVQIALRERGYYAGVVDGYLGQDTANGIQRFQVDQCQRVKPVVVPPLLVSLGLASDK
jgi:peptidoglycan hydrolase-like protein with peptidoglycan-binding domain